MLGREISDKTDILETVTEILNCISDAELQLIFRSWVERFESVIDAGGGYLTE
jgi:hypothetical protein